MLRIPPLSNELVGEQIPGTRTGTRNITHQVIKCEYLKLLVSGTESQIDIGLVCLSPMGIHVSRIDFHPLVVHMI
jgi:hypothetical protein